MLLVGFVRGHVETAVLVLTCCGSWHRQRLASPMAQVSIQSPSPAGPRGTAMVTPVTPKGWAAAVVLTSSIEKWVPLPSLQWGECRLPEATCENFSLKLFLVKLSSQITIQPFQKCSQPWIPFMNSWRGQFSVMDLEVQYGPHGDRQSALFRLLPLSLCSLQLSPDTWTTRIAVLPQLTNKISRKTERETEKRKRETGEEISLKNQ